MPDWRDHFNAPELLEMEQQGLQAAEEAKQPPLSRQVRRALRRMAAKGMAIEDAVEARKGRRHGHG